MKSSLFFATLVASALTLSAAEPATETTKKNDEPAATPAPASTPQSSPAGTPAVDATAQGAPTPAGGTEVAATAPVRPAQDPTLLPQVEVNKSRITNLDIEISEQQRAIDREKLKTKPTKLDDTLNNGKIAKTFSIFGGSSSEERSGLAKERVRILEEEKQILEAMKTAQSREERDELKKELEILREMRRDLDLGQK
jgi:hypothetical protein